MRGLILPVPPGGREARPPVRLERIIHWQRSKCHFMVMQHSRFLIHCTQPRHLPWPRAGSSSQGHRGPWLAPLPSLLGSVPETQRTLQLPCWDRARDGSPPAPLPTSFPAWSILTWHILPPLSPSTAPAPSSPTLQSPGTPVKAAQQLMGKGIWEVFPVALSSPGLYFTSGRDLSPAQAQAP